MFIVSIADINKALRAKVHTDLKKKLPNYFYAYLPVFDRKVSDTLPPFCGPRVDYRIKLEKDKEGRELEVL